MLLSFLRDNLPDLQHERRFEWLYRGNPDGLAWSWFLFTDGGQLVGLASLFPRSMWVGEKQQRCAQVGDFAITAGYRSLGPALLLQRATFTPVDQGEVAFCFDCPPHDAGMSTFRRLGMHPNCRVDRYAVPLRLDHRLRNQLGAASRIPATVGNLILRLRQWPALRHRSTELVIDEHLGPFGEEFSQLDFAVRKANVIRGRRSATHLNWRYRQDPLQEYHVLTARRAGELIALAVYSVSNDVVTIVDLFGRELAEAAASLLAAVIERFRKSHQAVDAYLSPGNDLVEHFLRSGFRLRSPAAQVVAYAAPKSEIAQLLQSEPTWSFTQAEVHA